MDAPSTLLREISRWSRRYAWHDRPGDLLVGVSGGVDSVVLLHALVRAGLRPHVLHVHHGLRSAADDEEALVRRLCRSLDLEVKVVRAPTAPPTGRQAWARAIRHAAFAECAQRHALSFVLVAHHADDQLETQILHLERGTGLAGLAGMPASRPLSADGAGPKLVRPLLDVPRSMVLDTAREWGLEWAEDASNQDLSYRRNAIRSELAAMTPEDLTAFRDAGLRVASRVRRLRRAVCRGLDSGRALPDADLAPWPRAVQELIVLEWLALAAPGLPRRSALARR
ncbi:MAG: tRNA lysidine(34) synthetase TilS, partial [Bacteroidetes bacterium]|nr:tRNA lysidine(34) synthetase TilS [Bacteroidota bacterium]